MNSLTGYGSDRRLNFVGVKNWQIQCELKSGRSFKFTNRLNLHNAYMVRTSNNCLASRIFSITRKYLFAT